MESGWRPLIAMVALLGGCGSGSAPPSPEPGNEPAASRAGRPNGKRPPTSPRLDAFGLPLDIFIDVPDVPKEIQSPSPPIRPEPKNSASGSHGFL